MSSNPWFETPLGQKYGVPDAQEYPIVIGRASPGAKGPKIEIPQSDQTMTVSRRHALLYRTEAGAWEIEDAGSTAGLYLNDTRLEKGVHHPLAAGDELRLGNFEIVFQTPEPAPRAAATPEAPTGDKTMVLEDFAPSEAPDWFVKGRGEEPGGGTETPEEERVWLDAWIEDEHRAIEVPQAPGVDSWTIGRAPASPSGAPESERHVQVPETAETKSVSRHHTRLHRTSGGGWMLANMSRQGVVVEGRPLKGDDQTALEPGNRMVLGTSVFILRVGPLGQPYSASDFDAEAVLRKAEEPATAQDADTTPTRPLPKGIAGAITEGEAASEEKPWGYLTESKLVDPLRYALSARKIRIGSHPINSDIKMEGPGITDTYAVIQWGARDVRILSKASDSPVHVNHTAYRNSPPLKDGDIVTLGTREFKFEIVSEPPVATSSLVSQRIRRMALVSIIVINVVFFGGLLAVKALVPVPQSAQPPARPEPSQLVETVVRDWGLAGLKLLERSEVGYGELGREFEPVLDALRALNKAHHMIHKRPARHFGDDVARIEDEIEKGRQVFERAGLSLDPSQSKWFSRDIVEVFEARRSSAYGTQWQDFLKSLEQTNIANAKNQLDQMTHFPPARLRAAHNLVSLWEACSEATRKKTEGDILRQFRKACNKGASYAYIQEERERLDALVADFDRIQNDPSEPARALMRSEKWKEYHAHVRSLRTTLGLLEHYQAGDVEAFQAVVEKIDPGDQSSLVATMRENLKLWVEWQARAQKAADRLSNFRLLADLEQLRLKFQGTLDARCPLAQEIDRHVESFKGARRKQAQALRLEAEKMTQGFEKLDKLISAYDYDPDAKALEALDYVATRLCGDIQTRNSAAANRKKIEAVLKRYETLAAKGVLNLDHIVSDTQFQALLAGAGN